MSIKSSILSFFGQMAPTQRDPERITWSSMVKEFSWPWNDIQNGYIYDEDNTELQWQNGAKTYDKMRKTDAQVNASLLVMELPIRSTRRYIEWWENENGEVSEQQQEIAEFLEKMLFDGMEKTRDDILREILTMLCFGYSVFEKVYWFDDEWRVVIKKLWYRKQSTIQQRETEDGRPWVLQQLDAPLYQWVNEWWFMISIPASKIVIFSHRREWDNYEGTSALRSAYKHRKFKDAFYRFDAIRHERQGVGIPAIWIPNNAVDSDRQWAENAVSNLRATSQTGIVFPWSRTWDKWWRDIAYIDTQATNSTGFLESIEHHNREIVKNVLAQFLELWNTKTWSRNLWESQQWLFLWSLGAVAKYIAETINRFLIKEIVDINFETNGIYPKLTFDSLQQTDKSIIVGNINKMIQSWLLPVDPILTDYVRELLELPAGEEKQTKEQEEKQEEETEKEENIEMKEKRCTHNFSDYNQWQDFFFVKQRENNAFIKKVQLNG